MFCPIEMVMTAVDWPAKMQENIIGYESCYGNDSLFQVWSGGLSAMLTTEWLLQFS